MICGGVCMTALRRSAIEELQKIPEEKLGAVLQFITELAEEKTPEEKHWDLDQFVMPPTERGQDAERYVRMLRDNDRL